MENLPDGDRRSFVKCGAYTAPAILTLLAAPEFAKAGSVKPPGDGPGGGHALPPGGGHRLPPGKGGN
jgi:hypothetical protein